MASVQLYLASASPRRREILEQLGISYEKAPQDVEELLIPGESPADFVCRLAKSKAEAVMHSLPDPSAAAVLGADTTVVCDDEVFEKPVDQEDCYRMLSSLSGRTHKVLTAVALATAADTEVLLSISEVRFRDLTETEIRKYWLTGEPVDKAGGYGIQGLGSLFVEEIKGSYSGIMGLPVMETARLLETIGMTAEVILEQQR